MKHAIDGIDLRPAFDDQPLGRDSLFWHYPHYSNQGGFPGGAIRRGNYKLVERYEDGRIHLFNLKKDAGEQTDLSDEMPDLVKSMRAELHDWYLSVDAKFLQPKDGQIPWNPKSNRP